MNPLKTLSFSACALIASTQVGQAALYGGFNITKDYRQDRTGAPVFREGDADFFIRDGNFAYTASCPRNGQGTTFGINSLIGCSIGANAVVVDTVVDSFPDNLLPVGPMVDSAYYELLSIQQAGSIEPGQNDLVRLYTIPANSTFPRTFDAVTGVPISIFYNLQNSNVTQYKNTQYDTARHYTSRSQMEREIVKGNYVVSFPTLNSRNVANYTYPPFYVPFEVIPMVEGYIGGNTPGGFRFINTGPFSAAGFSQYDPRVTNTFQWAGLSPSVVAPTDKLYISFKTLSSATDPTAPISTVPDPDNPLEPKDVIVFPPAGGRILLANPYITQYVLPPGFNFIGQNVVLEVTVERSAGINGGELCSRSFQLPIKFVNTFTAAMSAAFPNGTAAVIDKDADPDGDGISNWLEWANGTDPNKANPAKNLSSPSLVQPAATRDTTPTPAYWQMAFDRPLANLENDVKPVVETSTNLSTWATLDVTPESGWTVVDDGGPKIYVRNSSPNLTEKRYFRIRYNSTN